MKPHVPRSLTAETSSTPPPWSPPKVTPQPRRSMPWAGCENNSQRKELVSYVKSLLQDYDTPADLHKPLSRWLASRDDRVHVKATANEVLDSINGLSTYPIVRALLSLTPLLRLASRWIIDSDAWSYDIGSSGIHHLIALGLNVNILILDATPYSVRNTVDPHRRKKKYWPVCDE